MNSLSSTCPGLQFVFICKTHEMNRASYRMWVHYLAQSLEKIGVHAKISTVQNFYPAAADVVVFDKGIKDDTITAIKNKLGNNVLFGAINPPAQSNLPVDFVIAGSREEACSLSNYPKVCFVPLIELPLHTMECKKHIDKDLIRICYHGNDLHLSSFQSSGLTAALERYDMEMKTLNKQVILTVISNKEKPHWMVGKPKMNIEYFKYDWESFPGLIERQDIGIVPNCYYKMPMPVLFKQVRKTEMSKTDFVMRLKNKSNYGRLLVFMQAGVPAVADLTPSHLELLSGDHVGFCAANELGWLKAFRALSTAAARNKIAGAAKNKVNLELDPVLWASRFASEIEELSAGMSGTKLSEGPEIVADHSLFVGS